MSHNVQFEGECEITSLKTLERALRLATDGKMRVDETQKQNRRYGNVSDPCDAAIVWNRELSEEEKQKYWEVGLRFDGNKYSVYADDYNGKNNPLFQMIGKKCEKLFNCYKAVVQMDVAEVQGDQILDFQINPETNDVEMLVEVR